MGQYNWAEFRDDAYSPSSYTTTLTSKDVDNIAMILYYNNNYIALFDWTDNTV